MRTMRFSTSALFFAALSVRVALGQATGAPIDRHALVTRHNITIHDLDPMGAMAVGNGEFAFNFDVTGLQSFPEYYEKTQPVGILSNWGWHSFPNPQNFTLDKFKMTTVPKYDRQFVYPASGTTNPPPDAAYLRGNPHRFGLARIGLEMTHPDGTKVAITDLKDIEEKLDIWTGLATSTFKVDGTPVKVQTVAHPNRDEVSTKIDSPLIASGHLKLRLAFPYASTSFGPDYNDWTHPDSHTTLLTRPSATTANFARTLDSTHYSVSARWTPGTSLAETAKHQYLLTGTTNSLEFTACFAPKPLDADFPDTFADALASSAAGWKQYWTVGGVIDLSATKDPRAAELERRLVLSQYVMAVHDGGSLPPAETGLAANSWFGKFHMEMYFWHSAHWALWGHSDILEKSLLHLKVMMPPGQAMAKLEGAKGVKWSKMTDPNGFESPSGVGPVLVWQQPHPIYLSELVYRAHKNDNNGRAVLDRYRDIVFQTADYMATFMDYDPARKQYVLGPGVGSADEKHTDIAHNLNPTMELGYWKWALETAQEWRARLGLQPDPTYAKVLAAFAPLPVRNNVYPTLELPADGGANSMTTWLYGILPGRGIDMTIMRNTLNAVSRGGGNGGGGQQAAVTWGPEIVAMCAARMGEPARAINILSAPFAPGKNPFMPSGYTVRRPDQTPMYMPANGGWLTAAAMMAAGWDGNTTHAPGYPKDWTVRYEGLQPMP